MTKLSDLIQADMASSPPQRGANKGAYQEMMEARQRTPAAPAPAPVPEEMAVPFSAGGTRDPNKREWTDEERRRVKAAYDQQVRDSSDATEGMGPIEKQAVGMASGISNVGRNIRNITGFMGDEDLAHAKMLDSDLSDDGWGSFGQFLGETSALSPLGFLGRGAAAVKAIPQFLRGRATSATGEGAAAGGLMADPGERKQGAGLGALVNLGADRVMATTGRIFKRGLLNKSKASEDLADLIEKKTGKRPFIPALLAADPKGGSTSTKAKTLFDTLSLMPTAKQEMQNQVSDLNMQIYEANLRQAFGGNKADVAVRVFKESGGDLRKALDAGNNAGKIKGFKRSQQSMANAAKGNVEGQYTPSQLYKAAEANTPPGADVSAAPMRSDAIKAHKVLESGDIGTSNVASRAEMHSLQGILGKSLDRIPGPVGEFLASPETQRFIMADTGLQRGLRAALDNKGGRALEAFVLHLQRAMSAQPAISDESSDFKSPQRRALEAIEGLQGQ